MAAWAMTTHKAQGMTLGRVIVDLSRSFEECQVYVVLSRAETLEGLKIEGGPERLRGWRGIPGVQDFARRMEAA